MKQELNKPDNRLLDAAENTARNVGQWLLTQFGKSVASEKGDSHNLVTEADLEAEQKICAALHKVLPEAVFLREEGESTGTVDSEEVWIVDPLDGTNNFAHGIPQFCVSIALVIQGQFQLGVIYDPNRDELFSAYREHGAWLNGKPICVSTRGTLQESVVCTGFYYDRGELVRRTLASIERLFSANVRGIRRLGSAALDLCWVACGRLDGYFEYQLGPWDYAAGVLIVQEAGGECTARDGQPMTTGAGNVIASNGLIHQDLLDQVRWTESASNANQ